MGDIDDIGSRQLDSGGNDIRPISELNSKLSKHSQKRREPGSRMDHSPQAELPSSIDERKKSPIYED